MTIKLATIFIILKLLSGQTLIAQSKLPLGQTLQIKIVSKDTGLVKLYNTYTFIQSDKKDTTLGRFIILKSQDTYEIKMETQIKLCRIIELRGQDYSIRGCSIYEGIYIDNNLFLNFNPEKPNVVLTVCSN